MAGAVVALDGVRDGPVLGDGHVEHVLLGVLDALGNGQGHLGGLAHAEADVALAVTDGNEGDEGHAAAALDGLGDTVDEDDALLKIRVLLALAISCH